MDLATEGLTRQDILSDESKHQKDRHWYGSNMEEPRCGRFPVGKKNRTVVWADWHLDQSLPAFFVVISMLQLPNKVHFFSSLTPHLQHCFPTGPELRYCHWQCCKLFLFPLQNKVVTSKVPKSVCVGPYQPAQVTAVLGSMLAFQQYYGHVPRTSADTANLFHWLNGKNIFTAETLCVSALKAI